MVDGAVLYRFGGCATRLVVEVCARDHPFCTARIYIARERRVAFCADSDRFIFDGESLGHGDLCWLRKLCLSH